MNARDAAIEAFAESIADYIATHPTYGDWDKRTTALEAVRILLVDIGAAQRFLDVLGVDVDLYTSSSPTTTSKETVK